MKFYTIQKRCTWNRWRKQGYLEAYDNNFAYEAPYKWMMEQMSNRLSNYRGEIPIWLWVEKPEWYRNWSNIPRKKFVLITLELGENEVLFSNFDAWHIPLNNSLFESGECWENVFDLEWCRAKFLDESEKETLQATTGRIELNKVIDVKFFTNRKSKY